jgi:hypothetical protein
MDLNLRYSEGGRENSLDAYRDVLLQLAFSLEYYLIRVHRSSSPGAESRSVLPLLSRLSEHLVLSSEDH